MQRREWVALGLVVAGVIMLGATWLPSSTTSAAASEEVQQATVASSPAAPVSLPTATTSSTDVPTVQDSSMSQPATESSASTTASSSDEPTPEPPAQVTVPAIAPAAPNRLEIPTIGMDIEVGQVASVGSADGSWSVTPPEATLHDLRIAYWWNEKQAPGNPAPGTAFLFMHTCKSISCAGNNLSHVLVGDDVTVTTPSGVLTYKVFREPQSFSKTGSNTVSNSTEVYNYDQPGVITLITCGRSAGNTGHSDLNWVVWAKLST